MNIIREESIKFFVEWIEKTLSQIPECEFKDTTRNMCYRNLRNLGVTQEEIDKQK